MTTTKEEEKTKQLILPDSSKEDVKDKDSSVSAGETVKEQPLVLDFEHAIKKGKNDLAVNISYHDHARMMQIVESVSGEIGWLSYVTRDKNEFTLVDVFVPPQEVSSTSVDVDSRKFHEVTQQIIDRYGDEKAFFEILPNLRGFCHSHCNMSVYWSGTDEDGINGLANDEFLVSIVMNKKSEIRARIDLFKPLRIAIDNVPVTIDYSESDKELEEIVKKNVVAKTYTQHVKVGGYAGKGFRDPGIGLNVKGSQKIGTRITDTNPFGIELDIIGSGESEKIVAFTKMANLLKGLQFIYKENIEMSMLLERIEKYTYTDKKIIAQVILAGCYDENELEEDGQIDDLNILLDKLDDLRPGDAVPEEIALLMNYYCKGFFGEKYRGTDRVVSSKSLWLFMADIRKVYASFSLLSVDIAYHDEHTEYLTETVKIPDEYKTKVISSADCVVVDKKNKKNKRSKGKK